MDRGLLLVNDGNSAVQIIGGELRWNGDSLVSAVQIRGWVLRCSPLGC